MPEHEVADSPVESPEDHYVGTDDPPPLLGDHEPSRRSFLTQRLLFGAAAMAAAVGCLVGALLLVDVAGDVDVRGRVEDFEIESEQSLVDAAGDVAEDVADDDVAGDDAEEPVSTSDSIGDVTGVVEDSGVAPGPGAGAGAGPGGDVGSGVGGGADDNNDGDRTANDPATPFERPPIDLEPDVLTPQSGGIPIGDDTPTENYPPLSIAPSSANAGDE